MLDSFLVPTFDCQYTTIDTNLIYLFKFSTGVKYIILILNDTILFLWMFGDQHFAKRKKHIPIYILNTVGKPNTTEHYARFILWLISLTLFKMYYCRHRLDGRAISVCVRVFRTPMATKGKKGIFRSNSIQIECTRRSDSSQWSCERVFVSP